MEKDEIKQGKLVTPIGQFGCQTYPLIKDNQYFLTDEEHEKLDKHELQWSSEEYEDDERIYEEKENENGEIEQVEIGTHKVNKTRPILIECDNSKEIETASALKRIAELKQLLASSDYKAIKYAEGALTKAEYAETKALRQSYRDEIKELEAKL